MRRPEPIVAGIVLAIFVTMVAAAFTYPLEAGLVPLVVGIPGTVLAAWQFLRAAIGRDDAPAETVTDVGNPERRAAGDAIAMVWVALFTLAVLAGGFVVGATLAVMVTHRLWLRESWRVTALGGAIALFVSYVCFQRLLGLVVFRGWLAAWIPS